ncbi:relaxase/mobilization nuclease domain-containing protein [uncultured Alistipes sp.]|uniref:relaxase/mobilization nuclease domain-containing protein n=1 Tax=uncultured Alistipes sp. TaxID=538949 RepID=UPI002588C495|nr:relaxase/mobilization nuclease domain-containing protein [uncultured Alistipes sp.]
MIGKIVTGKSFGGAVEYVLRKEKARLLDSDGVDAESIRSIIDGFNFQRKARREIAKVVGHISLSFHRDDAPTLTDDRMRELAAAYMECMGIADTQYIVARHNDTEHPHLHIIYNRVKYDRTLVADKNERRRNVKVCKQLKRRYGLTFSNGKRDIKTERLHGADKVRQEVFDAITRILPKCDRIADLSAKLKRQGIGVQFVHRGNDPKKAVQGVTFTKDGLTFKGSQVDRKFSYAGLSKTIRERAETLAREAADEEIKYMRERRREQERDTTPKPQKAERPQPPQVKREETPRLQPATQQPEQRQPAPAMPQPSAPQQVEIGGTRFTQDQWRQLQENRMLRIIVRRSDEAFTRELVTAIKGCRLTVQEQKQLYSELGLIKAFRRQDGTVYRSRFGVESKPGQKDMLTECVLSVQQPQEVKPDTKPQMKPEQQQKPRPQVKQPENIQLYRKKGRGI